MFLLRLFDFAYMAAAGSNHLSAFDQFVFKSRTILSNFFVLFSSMSWQIRLCLLIIAVCSLVSFTLGVKLWRRSRKERKSNISYAKFRNRYKDRIISILEQEALMDKEEIEAILRIEDYEPEEDEEKKKTNTADSKNLWDSTKRYFSAIGKYAKNIFKNYKKEKAKEDYEKRKTEELERDGRIVRKDGFLSEQDLLNFVRLVSEVRWEWDYDAYLPNIKTLCDAVGITEYYELELIDESNVFTNLQEIITLPLPLNHESVLANYLNDKDTEIRNLSRMCYIVSTQDDPYKYLQLVLNENTAQWNTMLLHRLFDWMHQQNRQMPKFSVLLQHTTNEHSASFLIQEIAKFGTKQEQDAVMDYLVDESMARRSAAFKALTEIWTNKQWKSEPEGEEEARRLEDFVLNAYESQREEQRRESLRLLKTIDTGRAVDRFEQSFVESPVVDTKVCAIECLIDYGGKAGVNRIIRMLSSYMVEKKTTTGYQSKRAEADQDIICQVIGLNIMSNIYQDNKSNVNS